MDSIIKIKANPAKFSEEMRKSKMAIMDQINQSFNMPSFSSYTTNNPDYWKEFKKEMNKMEYKDLKRDNTVYHCVFGGEVNYLFRFIDGDRKQIINCHTGEVFGDSIAFNGSGMNEYQLANLEEQCRFYSEFGYKDVKGRTWKVGDNDSGGDKIEGFEIGYDGGNVWTKSRRDSGGVSWQPTRRVNNYGGELPVEKSSVQLIQESLDVAQELVKSGYMSIDQSREAMNPTKPEKVHWFKRFIRKLV